MIEIVGFIKADLYLGSEIHAPMKLTDEDRDDVFLAVFAEIAGLRECSQ